MGSAALQADWETNAETVLLNEETSRLLSQHPGESRFIPEDSGVMLHS